MRNLALFFVFVYCIVSATEAQKFDSLMHISKTSKIDSVKLIALIELGDLFRETNYDSAYVYYSEGLSYAKSVSYKLGVGHALYSLSRIASYKGTYSAAIDTLNSALRFYTEVGHIRGVANVYNSLGVNFFNLAQYDTARYFYYQALSANTDFNDSVGIATNHANLGVIAYVQGNYDDALMHYIKALEIREKIGSNHSKASIYMKVALIYDLLEEREKSYEYLIAAISLYSKEGLELERAKAMINLSNTLYKMDSAKTAKNVLLEANRTIRKIGNKRILSTACINMGHAFMREDNLDSALMYFYEALDLVNELKQKRELSNLYINIGDVFYRSADYDGAIEYFLGSLEIMKAIGTFDSKAFALEMLSSSYEKKNDFKNAYSTCRQYAQFKDSILNIEKDANLARIEAVFKKRQQEQRIALLENQQRLNEFKLQKAQSARNFVIIISLLGIVLTVVLFQRYRQKVKMNKILHEKNKEVQLKNKEIQTQASNMEEFNRLLVEKNRFIEKQKIELELVNETKDRFFSIIGHDLRSPIAAVFSTIGLMRIKDYSGEKQRKLLGAVESNLQTTLDLLENLMFWAKSQDKNLRPNFQLVNLNELITKSIEAVDSMTRAKQIRVSFTSGQNYMANVDINMMATVLRNLLSNAVKFSFVQGHIQVNIVQQSETIKVQVEDEGVGMNREVLKRIMAKNSYFTSEGTKNERGSGLGLNLCKNFIELHGGVFMVESQEGKGSVFSFTLPVAK